MGRWDITAYKFMTRKTILLLCLLSIVLTASAQSYTVNQQSQQVNINVPVIEKPVYIERYRTVYVNKPRKARKLSEPVLLLGYLWVYPEDLGSFKQVPISVIKSVNAQRPYGRNNWRIPTPDELAVLEANAERIGLGDDIYLATDHRNGTLRLVAIDGEYEDCVKVGNTYWKKTNLGASRATNAGSTVTYEDALRFCPAGYRLPTRAEYEALIASGQASFEKINENRSADLYFPAMYYEGHTPDMAYYPTYNYDGYYFLQGNRSYFEFSYYKSVGTFGETHVTKPKISSGKLSEGLVRYVLDK